MKKFISNDLFIIAEISTNHNGSFSNAVKLINMAKQNGANAVKAKHTRYDDHKENKIKFKIRKDFGKITIFGICTI